jgi:ArsR family transcriptional regulator
MKEPSPACKPGDHVHTTRMPDVARPGARERAARIFRALGDVPRLRLLEMLAQDEFCVTELVSGLGEKFSTVSQRLRLLRSEGLVRRRREGTHMFYALADRHVADLIHKALAHADEFDAGPAEPDEVQFGGPR